MVKLKACVLAAKQREALGFDETNKLATLREHFMALCDELETLDETPVAAILDDLSAATDQVRAEAAPEWVDALDAGWSWLREQDIIRVDAHGVPLVPSSHNLHMIYRGNGTCQCPAFTKHSTPRPYYYRALA